MVLNPAHYEEQEDYQKSTTGCHGGFPLQTISYWQEFVQIMVPLQASSLHAFALLFHDQQIFSHDQPALILFSLGSH